MAHSAGGLRAKTTTPGPRKHKMAPTMLTIPDEGRSQQKEEEKTSLKQSIGKTSA